MYPFPVQTCIFYLYFPASFHPFFTYIATHSQKGSDQSMPSFQLHTSKPINHITSAACTALGLPQSQPTWICPLSGDIWVPENMLQHHTHGVAANQCCSSLVQAIDAPVDTVWSVVRRFDKPHAYKNFLKSCHVILGDGHVGTLREVQVVSGLPAACSTERLEVLDDEKHVMSFRVVGGDHRLHNYRSVTTLHAVPPPSDGGGSDRTVVVESYLVDIPLGNTTEETCAFVDIIVKCNLQSLAQIAKNLAKNDSTSS